MNGVADSAACRRLKGRSRRLRERCNGQARRTTETPELRRRTRRQMERAEGPAVSAAEHSEDYSLYSGVVIDARLSGHRLFLRLYSACCCAAPGRHHATLHCRRYGQSCRLPMHQKYTFTIALAVQYNTN